MKLSSRDCQVALSFVRTPPCLLKRPGGVGLVIVCADRVSHNSSTQVHSVPTCPSSLDHLQSVESTSAGAL